jgi:hypothetical protein
LQDKARDEHHSVRAPYFRNRQTTAMDRPIE